MLSLLDILVWVWDERIQIVVGVSAMEVMIERNVVQTTTVDIEFPVFKCTGGDHSETWSRIDYVGGLKPFRYSSITRSAKWLRKETEEMSISVEDELLVSDIDSNFHIAMDGWHKNAMPWRVAIDMLRQHLQRIAEFGNLPDAQRRSKQYMVGGSHDPAS